MSDSHDGNTPNRPDGSDGPRDGRPDRRRRGRPPRPISKRPSRPRPPRKVESEGGAGGRPGGPGARGKPGGRSGGSGDGGSRGGESRESDASAAPQAARSENTQVVQIRFKGLRDEYFAFDHPVPLREREYVVVEADRGRDIGVVRRAATAKELACEGGCSAVGERSVPLPEKRVIRRAAPADVNRLLQLREQEMEVRRRTREMVQTHRLRMKVSEAEWQWDRNKLTVYFTADKRVDFRALVRDMARAFRTRIELRQIGVRDEARRIGGLGRCRRELCCRAWLPSIEPVTLQLAKDQGLSLNPSQISGACGRLMNCLRYEHAMYQQAKKRFPNVGRTVTTGEGEERVRDWNMFDETVSLDGPEGSRTIPLTQLKNETRSGKRRKLEGDDPRPAADAGDPPAPADPSAPADTATSADLTGDPD